MHTDRRIGFVDYALDNWHTNHFLRTFRTDLEDRGFRVAGCWAMQEQAGRDWARENDVAWFGSPESLDCAVDFYMVLAPSNPETHLAVCERVLPFGKTTYVDKTFAPDVETARDIFALADRCGVRVETTSPHRYTEVQAHVADVGRESVLQITTWGGGRSFDEYAIHPVEMAVSCLGPGVERLLRRGGDEAGFWQICLDLTDGRMATVNVGIGGAPLYGAAVTTPEGTQMVTVDMSRLFVGTGAAVLDFFEERRPPIDRAETLMVRRILDVAADPVSAGMWVAL